MSFLSIDPGQHPGYAVLDEKFVLIWCGISVPGFLLMSPPRAVLCERPTIYPKMKVDPSNIITLAITAGKLVQPWIASGAKELWVEPRSWKGNIPKGIHHAAILHALPPSEQDVVSKCGKGIAPSWREDMMDAVGLAAYGRKMHLFS